MCLAIRCLTCQRYLEVCLCLYILTLHVCNDGGIGWSYLMVYSAEYVGLTHVKGVSLNGIRCRPRVNSSSLIFTGGLCLCFWIKKPLTWWLSCILWGMDHQNHMTLSILLLYRTKPIAKGFWPQLVHTRSIDYCTANCGPCYQHSLISRDPESMSLARWGGV